MSITYKEVVHEYNHGTMFSYVALDDVSLTLQDAQITAIVGKTGSGKSTLVQHLNALILPTKGSVDVDGIQVEANKKPKQWKELRKKVGFVFQFPEYQLFEETVAKDIAFGPKNFGYSEKEALEKVKEILPFVGLDPSYLEKSPFELSGGQKRKVAIAGTLVMNPDILVLDEPTAGLDPQSAKEMMELFVSYNKIYHKTIIIVTHDMDHVLNYCDHVVVLEKGEVLLECEKDVFFQEDTILDSLEIQPPAMIRLQRQLKEKGWNLNQYYLTMNDMMEAIVQEVMQNE